MSDVDAFLQEMLPKLKAADAALHNGDANARAALWSRNTPLTLFGAAVTTSGWKDISATFDFHSG
jgi:hypothetical protein